MDVLILLVFVLMPLGLISAAIATSVKKRPFLRWWVFGTFLWPIALVASLAVKPDKREYWQCPSCRLWINHEATKCRHCTADVPVG